MCFPVIELSRPVLNVTIAPIGAACADLLQLGAHQTAKQKRIQRARWLYCEYQSTYYVVVYGNKSKKETKSRWSP